MLKILPVEIVGPARSINTFAFLDDGSTTTLIDQQLARYVGSRGETINIRLKGITGGGVHTSCEKVAFVLNGELGAQAIDQAYAIPRLELPSQSLSRELVRQIAKTHSVFMQPYTRAAPKLLIGQDNWKVLANTETRCVSDTALAISKSRLGWVAHGPTGRRKAETIAEERPADDLCAAMCVRGGECECPIEKIDELIREYFLIDNLGVGDAPKPLPRYLHAYDTLKKTLRRDGNVWEIGLLWKEKQWPRVDSYSTALKRLYSIEKKLDSSEQYATLYYREILRLIDSGYAVKIDEDTSPPRTWYLPHFGVAHVNKPGKLRLVFDAAAKSSGQSLNDQLETGPDLLQSLYGVLIRFRQFKIAFKADIRDMYLRVRVQERDREALRFLWRGRRRRGAPEIYAMTRLIFGARCSPCCALYVKDANAREFVAEKPEAAKSIIANSYVDDFLGSKRTANEATQIIADVLRINSRANFEMHGWATNDERVLESVPRSARVRGDERMQLCDRGGERVLGLSWDTSRDELAFKVGVEKIPDDILTGTRKPTKREF